MNAPDRRRWSRNATSAYGSTQLVIVVPKGCVGPFSHSGSSTSSSSVSSSTSGSSGTRSKSTPS